MSIDNLPLEVVIEWDIKNWSKSLEFWNNHTAQNPRDCRVLEIGARKGGLSLYMADRGANVVCSDVKTPGLEVRTLHCQMVGEKQIHYASIDASAIPFINSSFDIVVFKSVLGALRMLSKQQAMMNEIYRVLRPEGELWFAENLVASPLHQLFRKIFVPWGQQWGYLTRAEIKALCKSYKIVYLEHYGFFATFGRTEQQRNFLGTIDAVINSYIPNQWKYIVFGLARK